MQWPVKSCLCSTRFTSANWPAGPDFSSLTKLSSGVAQRILISDLLVWVEHNSDLSSNSLWWEIFGEVSSDEAVSPVTCDNLAPDCLVVDSGGGVLFLVYECDAFAVIPFWSATVLTSLDLNESLSLLLSPLSTSESSESALCVKSTKLHWNEYPTLAIKLEIWLTWLELQWS